MDGIATLAGVASNREQWSEKITLTPKSGALPTFEEVKVAIGGNCSPKELTVANGGVVTEVSGSDFSFTFTFPEATMRQLAPGSYSLGIVLVASGIATQFGIGTVTVKDGVVS